MEKLIASLCAYCKSAELDISKLAVALAWSIHNLISARENDGLPRLTFQLTHLASRHRWMGKMTLTHIRPTFLCKDRSMIIRK